MLVDVVLHSVLIVTACTQASHGKIKHGIKWDNLEKKPTGKGDLRSLR